MDVNTAQRLGLGVLGLGVIFHIVGTATPGWITADIEYVNVGEGLFQFCVDSKGCETYDLDKASSKGKTVIALCLTGAILSASAAVMAFCTMRRLNSSNKPAVVCMFLSLVSGAAIIVAVVIYGVEFHKADDSKGFELGYSFGFCITGAILIVNGGVLIFLGRNGNATWDSIIQPRLVLMNFPAASLCASATSSGNGTTAKSRAKGVKAHRKWKGSEGTSRGKGATITCREKDVTTTCRGKDVTTTSRGKGATATSRGRGATTTSKGKGATVTSKGEGATATGRMKGATSTSQEKVVSKTPSLTTVYVPH